MAVDITEFDKDQLAEYALSEFNKELDLRKSLDKLKSEVLVMQSKPQPKTVQPAKENPKATHILNRDTGFWFPWTEALQKHLTNAVPCDENGNPV